MVSSSRFGCQLLQYGHHIAHVSADQEGQVITFLEHLVAENRVQLNSALLVLFYVDDGVVLTRDHHDWHLCSVNLTHLNYRRLRLAVNLSVLLSIVVVVEDELVRIDTLPVVDELTNT